MRRLALAALALALSTTVGVAGGEVGGGCFERVYDGAHLAAHPRQTVERIAFGPSRAEGETAEAFTLAFELREAGGAFVATAYCSGDAARRVCRLEGDGGGFTVEARGADLRLSVDGFLVVEGETGFSPDLAESDDRVFLLRPAASDACP